MALWVEKYKPTSTSDLIGQYKNVARVKSWLKTFDPSKSRPLFIYGPPGIGKTTAVHLCCKETNYTTIEFNASDQRNKNIIKDVISTVASNSRLNFFGRASETRDAIILDEVDGMAGNEDRGGIAQLILELKHTKKPMIFICNDGQHQKLRSLKDKCETLEFRKPDMEGVRAVVTKIAKREGLSVQDINIKELAESTDYDIRQIVNSLSLFRDGAVQQMVKTTRINAFEAAKKALTASRLTLEDRFDCFFSDYSIMSLFIFENYIKNSPAKGDPLGAVAKAAQSLSLSDLAEKEIRANQHWSLLNVQALLSTVIPSSLVASHNVGRIDFPQFMGKLSNLNKRSRLTQELNSHMCLSLRGGLDPDYLDVMSARLSAPLIKKELGGVDAVLDFMEDYSLLREDLNSIMELATWSFKPDPMSKVDSKSKTALTLAYKKRSIMMPYFVDSQVAKKRKVPAPDNEDDEEEPEEEEEEEEVIKPKRVIKNDKTSQKPAPKKTAKDKKEKPAVQVVDIDDDDDDEEHVKPTNGKTRGRKPAAAAKTTESKKEKNGNTNGNGKAKTTTSAAEISLGSAGSTQESSSVPSKNEPKSVSTSKPDKRPPENGGIARFFTTQTKKQRSS